MGCWGSAGQGWKVALRPHGPAIRTCVYVCAHPMCLPCKQKRLHMGTPRPQEGVCLVCAGPRGACS